MALRHALLAALVDGESSGYDLAKSFDVAVANFWSATPQQLYRELEKLKTDGLVHARLVEQTHRPNKRVFTLTEAGRATLREFIGRQPKPTAIRDELLVQVEAMEFADRDTILSHLAAKTAAAQHKLDQYLRSREDLLDGRDETAYLADTERFGHFLTLARGIAFEEENIRWCAFVEKALEQRTR